MNCELVALIVAGYSIPLLSLGMLHMNIAQAEAENARLRAALALHKEEFSFDQYIDPRQQKAVEEVERMVSGGRQ